MTGTGFFPTERSNIYALADDDLYLTGTSEVALAGLHMGEIVPADELPLRYAGFSTNFRREAGAAGKDTRGMFRVHQFNKVEMFVYTTADESWAEHERMLALEEAFAQKLGLPYRVVNVAAGDLGAPAAKKYDIEAWFPSQERYREITSCSNTTDFQSRRLGIRARGESGIEPLHTLNGTMVTDRALLAILENFQGDVPDALREYGAPERVTASLEPPGGVPERSNGAVLKTVGRASVPCPPPAPTSGWGTGKAPGGPPPSPPPGPPRPRGGGGGAQRGARAAEGVRILPRSSPPLPARGGPGAGGPATRPAPPLALARRRSRAHHDPAVNPPWPASRRLRSHGSAGYDDCRTHPGEAGKGDEASVAHGAGELFRQAEPGEDVRPDEGGDVGDEFAVERDDVDRGRQVSARLGVEVEVRDGDLPVRGDGQSERHSAELRSLLRHLGDRVPAAPPARPGRHREGRVRRQECSNGFDVPPRPGIDVGLDELADASVAERA